EENGPLILIKKTSSTALTGATQIFVRSKERKNVFVAVATALDQLNLSIQDARIYTSKSGHPECSNSVGPGLWRLNLSIQDARIYTSKSGYTVDTFFVLNQN